MRSVVCAVCACVRACARASACLCACVCFLGWWWGGRGFSRGMCSVFFWFVLVCFVFRLV